MEREHEAFLLLMGTALLLLLGFSLAARPCTRLYRWAQRIFWSFALLWLSGEMGLVGISGLSLAAVSLLGAPGYALLAVIANMP